MREFSKDLTSTIICNNNDKKRCKTVNGKRKNSQSTNSLEQVVVGKYKYFTDSLLGQGFSSKVFKGIQIDKPQKRFAIKVIQLRKFQGETLKMLEQQINIHRNLKHENIVQCYDAIKTKNNYFLILEYCPHGSLQDFIQTKKKLGLASACQIMEQISQGYKYLLSNNIVHRDIKPANILKFQNTWKIADFGFAVRRSVSFRSPMNVGTPLYMPLQALIRSQYSFKSDIFAIGVTFYQMIHGETPWVCRTQQQLIQSMKKDELFFSNYISNHQIKSFIKKACAMDNKDRMTHQQFQKIEFLSLVQKKNAFKQKIVFRAISPRKNSLQTQTSLKAFAQKNSNIKDSINQIKTSQNELIAEVTISKHIYSMISNIDSFLLDQKSKQFFWMTLFKFLVRFIRETEKKSQAIKTKCGKNLYNQIKQLALKYQKQYLDYLKHLQVKVIREVNTKFCQLCQKAPFTKSLYQKIQDYLVIVLKQLDKNIMMILKQKQKNQQSYKDKIEAFRALKKFFQHCSENKEAENNGCRKIMEVCQNYKQLEKNNESEFYTMRKVLISF